MQVINYQGNPQMDSILKLPEVTRITGIGRSNLYALIQRGEFPKPVKLSVRSVGWRQSEVNAWLSELKAA